MEESNKDTKKDTKKDSAKKKESFNFEQNLQQLEKIVTDLESGNLSLEDSITAFENGLKLAQQGQKKLTETENRIKVLMQKTADAKLENYSANSSANISNDDICF